MGPSRGAVLCAGHVLPAAAGQEAVIATRDELCAIFERDAVRALDGRPVVEHLGNDVAAVLIDSHGPEDPVPGPHVLERLRSAIAHENGGIATGTVGASVRAASIRIDRPAEWHPGLLGNVVERRAGVDLVEADVHRLGGVERADHGVVAVAR